MSEYVDFQGIDLGDFGLNHFLLISVVLVDHVLSRVTFYRPGYETHLAWLHLRLEG